MRRAPVSRLMAWLIVVTLVVSACSSGSGSGTSTGDSTGSSNGSSSGDSNGSSDASSGGSGGTTAPGGPQSTQPGATRPGAAPPEASAPAPPAGYTLPKPDGNGQVEVPQKPPLEVRDKSPRQRLRDLPPVPTSCLDPDLTLLDIFAPFFSVPLRLTYCLLYVATLARLPSEVDVTVTTPGIDVSGGRVDVRVGIIGPTPQRQRGLATIALIVLLLVVGTAAGYYVGRRRRR